MAGDIHYIPVEKVCKAARGKYAATCGFLMVDVLKRMRYGKVSIETYCFDIPCAYAPVNRIGHDILESDADIRELNWTNLFADFLKPDNIYYDTAYVVWNFLRRKYPIDSRTAGFGDDCHRYLLYYGCEKFAEFNERTDVPEWCNGRHILHEIDLACVKLEQIGTDVEFASRLRDVLRLPVMSKTLEQELRERGVIDGNGKIIRK